MVQIPIYYINLAARPDRREFMEQQFTALGLKAERIEAVTPKDLLGSEIEKSCNPRNYRWLTPVELACNRSHLLAMQRIAAGDAALGLILEDDVVLSSRLPAAVQMLAESPPPADILKIETDCRYIRRDPNPAAMLGGFRLEILRGFSFGGGAYVVGKSPARVIIDSQELLTSEVDRALFDPHEPLGRKFKLRHLNPSLCIQLVRLEESPEDLTASNIDGLRTQRGAAERKVRAHRLHHEARKFLRDKFVVDVNHIYHERFRGAKKARIEFVP